MKLPRDVSGSDLVKALKRLDYVEARQTGSHIRLTISKDGEHHLTIPAHDPLKLGTYSRNYYRYCPADEDF
jgi:predicted RNA binding protein YcfA (HicA-like mRNA interferase family)